MRMTENQPHTCRFLSDFLIHHSAGDALRPILSNPAVFAVNLYETPLAGKIEKAFRDMLVPGGVRKSLQKV